MVKLKYPLKHYCNHESAIDIIKTLNERDDDEEEKNKKKEKKMK